MCDSQSVRNVVYQAFLSLLLQYCCCSQHNNHYKCNGHHLQGALLGSSEPRLKVEHVALPETTVND